MKIIKNPINNTLYLKETVKVKVSRENFLEKFKKNDVESFKDVLDHTCAKTWLTKQAKQFDVGTFRTHAALDNFLSRNNRTS